MACRSADPDCGAFFMASYGLLRLGSGTLDARGVKGFLSDHEA